MLSFKRSHWVRFGLEGVVTRLNGVVCSSGCFTGAAGHYCLSVPTVATQASLGPELHHATFMRSSFLLTECSTSSLPLEPMFKKSIYNVHWVVSLTFPVVWQKRTNLAHKHSCRRCISWVGNILLHFWTVFLFTAFLLHSFGDFIVMLKWQCI